ncbi:protein of unknown function [Klenkia marina]|uniref:DUF202 domain-containing protein n=1 Tax=Klenkia marina TaxID=1960309 RepID=A0A1G4YLS3_9ACTN|nr:DUF202 domain-containing protein [Klenkia marina]SCX54279.1 protein of unknown function [Klenkia marina]
MTAAAGQVPDAGLQPERTVLAWRRTALAMTVAAATAGRLAAPVLGTAALVLAAAGVALAVLVAVVAGRRYRAVRESLRTRGDLTGVARPALPLAALAGSGVVVGVLALVVVVGQHAGR